jgi:hypothetical protein
VCSPWPVGALVACAVLHSCIQRMQPCCQPIVHVRLGRVPSEGPCPC